MGEAIKKQLVANGCAEHVEEFGECVGVVEGLTDYGTSQGPEVEVWWQPSKLRYAYLPEELVAVRT